MRRNLLAKLILLLTGTLVGLILAELVLRLARPLSLPHPPGMYTADPDVGYVLTPGFEGTLTGAEFRAPVAIGKAGLRGADPRPRRADTRRFLVLGDSLAWGYGVADDETLSYHMERLLAEHYPTFDIQVLNGAVPGYGTADELDFLRSRGRLLDPDVVVLVFLSVNDFDENRVPARTWADVVDGMLVSTKNAEGSGRQSGWLRVKHRLKKKSHFFRLLSDSAGYAALRSGLLVHGSTLWDDGENFNDEDAGRAKTLLREVARSARDLGAHSLFLLTTGQDHVLGARYPRLRSATVVEEAATAAGVPWIDVTPILRQRDDRLRLYYPLDGHWTALGHRAVAEILCREIVRLEWVEPR